MNFILPSRWDSCRRSAPTQAVYPSASRDEYQYIKTGTGRRGQRSSSYHIYVFRPITYYLLDRANTAREHARSAPDPFLSFLSVGSLYTIYTSSRLIKREHLELYFVQRVVSIVIFPFLPAHLIKETWVNVIVRDDYRKLLPEIIISRKRVEAKTATELTDMMVASSLQKHWLIHLNLFLLIDRFVICKHFFFFF